MQVAEEGLEPRPRQPHLPRPRDRRRRGRRRAPAARTRPSRRPTPRRPTPRSRRGPTGTYRSGSADFALAATEAGALRSSACWTRRLRRLRRDAHVPRGERLHQLEARAVDAPGTRPEPAHRTLVGRCHSSRTATSRPRSPAGPPRAALRVPAWKPAGGALSLGERRRRRPAGRPLDRHGRRAASSVNASPWPVNSATAGATYTARGSVRSETPGKDVCLRLREYDGSTLVGSAQTCVTTTGAWRQYPRCSTRSPRAARELNLLVYQVGTAAAGDPSTSTASRSQTARPPRCRPLRRSPATRCCSGRGHRLLLVQRRRGHSRLLDTPPGVIGIAGDTEQNHGTPPSSGLLRLELGPPQARASSRPWATTSTALRAPPATSTTSGAGPGTA